MNAAVKAIAGRLAAGSQGRTEADIQADVRMFLLEAPLDLGGEDLTDVMLETQAGGGRRIDVEVGHAVIEVKKSLASPTVRSAAREQLAAYVRQRTEDLGQRYVGILTDGRTWLLHHLLLDGSLVQARELTLADVGEAERLAAWLESVLATVEQVTPTPREILRKLGADSAPFALDLAELHDLYKACRRTPEVQLKRELWGRLLTAALGTNFEDSDELFVTHTYLVLTAELIAHAVAGIPLHAGQDVRALLEGQQFRSAGLYGVVEADFFDWPALQPEGARVVRAIARRLATFDWTAVDHDILKALYESVIDADTRHRLGEYYTPDWLAEHMVERHVRDPLNERVLDPACGSGTFLFWAVRRVLAAADARGMSNREALGLVVERVFGIDLHPVAVTLARVTYLLAIGRRRLADRDELTIPVYLGDSVRWEQDTSLLHQGGITIHTSDGMELFAQDLHFPEGVLEEPARFDQLVAALADRAADRPVVPQSQAAGKRTSRSVPSIVGLMKAHGVRPDDQAAVELVFEKLCRLRDAGRDHVWGYYIRNLARPLSFTRPNAQADVLIGNPPWLSYRHMGKLLQERYQSLARPRGLWVGGKVATQQDLSDLFVARTVEQYLRPGGRFAFVMPFAVLSRRQYAGFRSGSFASQGAGVQAVAFETAEEFARVKPPLFPVPACVIAGTRSARPEPLRREAVRWTGRVPDHHVGWEVASERLHAADDRVVAAYDAHVSPYRSRFSNGATMYPRPLVVVALQPAGPLGIPAGRTAVASWRSSNEKPPWKTIDALTGVIEDEFLRPMHLGATIVAYRPREPFLAVVPILDGRPFDEADPRFDEFPGFAGWWRQAERQWVRHRTSRMTLLEQVNFQGKLHKQFPIARHRVVYTKSGQHLAACRIEDREAIIDHKLYWAEVETIEEARYLTAVLNSQALADAVVSLQARGQHNPRDFDMHVFALGFPAFDALDPVHRQLVELATRAETVAAAAEFEPAWQFQRARRVTRERLRADGVADEIDAAVQELLRQTAQR
jgi:SAM-dependent methyltransferase